MPVIVTKSKEPNGGDKVQDYGPHKEDPRVVENIPPAVIAAINFVSMSNSYRGHRCWSNDLEMVVVEEELHHNHEGAFRLACELVGTYFAAHRDAINSERNSDERQREFAAAVAAEIISQAGASQEAVLPTDGTGGTVEEVPGQGQGDPNVDGEALGPSQGHGDEGT